MGIALLMATCTSCQGWFTVHVGCFSTAISVAAEQAGTGGHDLAALRGCTGHNKAGELPLVFPGISLSMVHMVAMVTFF